MQKNKHNFQGPNKTCNAACMFFQYLQFFLQSQKDLDQDGLFNPALRKNSSAAALFPFECLFRIL